MKRPLLQTAVVLALVSPGCGCESDARGPALMLSRKEPFALAELLTEAFAASSAPSVEVAFEVLDSDGEPVPFAHLHFAWEEGGTLAFQTDEEAALVMRFERAAPTGDAAVWVRTLPEGHVFTTEREASWQPLAAGEVRIAVRVGA